MHVNPLVIYPFTPFDCRALQRWIRTPVPFFFTISCVGYTYTMRENRVFSAFIVSRLTGIWNFALASGLPSPRNRGFIPRSLVYRRLPKAENWIIITKTWWTASGDGLTPSSLAEVDGSIASPLGPWCSLSYVLKCPGELNSFVVASTARQLEQSPLPPLPCQSSTPLPPLDDIIV